ncbi:hypothetical protein N825_07390 [Skermanella stibiiresistens SB22]|uniref:Uncharacterized protein n=1 Tax=Skermanella stibiiresistens SB22 TaxID=1385369 RepID=W9H695_9PROT|nr:hypothetical protein [Skermanella stibiiresistens]EWY39283.1 hypothetical protein N825_07390 [Skermanella stibiiresistens SB22]
MWTTILATSPAYRDVQTTSGEEARVTVILIRVAAVLLGFIPTSRRSGGTIMAVRGQRCVKTSPP